MRATSGCLENVCSFLFDSSEPVVAAALVILGNYGAHATASDLRRMRSAGGISQIYRLILSGSEETGHQPWAETHGHSCPLLV